MWIKCTPSTMPDEGQAVIWRDNDQMWFGGYCDPSADDGPCLVATRAFSTPDWIPGRGWTCDDCEWHGDQPTHWHTLPGAVEQ